MSFISGVAEHRDQSFDQAVIVMNQIDRNNPKRSSKVEERIQFQME